MKKVNLKYIAVLGMVFILTACGDEQSAVDKVIEQQVEDNAAGREEMAENIDEEAAQADNESDSDENISSENAREANYVEGQIDVDLTTLSSTMVYSEVYNMMVTPENYIGKTVKMNGIFSVFENQETGQVYMACIISDATACCNQGIEFVLDGEYKYPDDYPEIGSEITVTGTFDTYEEEGNLYCQLIKAVME